MNRSKVKQIVKHWRKFACAGSHSRVDSESTWKSDESGNSTEVFPEGSLAVFVGKERRRYIVSDQDMKHPLLKSLLERCAEEDDEHDNAGISIQCEIVLFEHLLWILRTGGSEVRESVDELVEFYACS